MTTSPFFVTLVTLIPLVALGWPLAKVINQNSYVVPPEVTENPTGPLVSADLEIHSAHPFESIKVKIGETSWSFTPEESIKQIYYPRDARLILEVNVDWPEGTPETAVLFTLSPDGENDLKHTLWGEDEITAEIEFTPNPEE